MGLTKKRASELGKKSTRKGVPNKSTAEIRQAFQKLISNKVNDFDKWIDEIAKEDPVKAFDVIIKLSDFILPKLQRTEIKGEITIQDLINLTPEQRRIRILELKNELKKA